MEKPQDDFEEFLLNSPTMTEEEYEKHLEARKYMESWN